MTRPRTTPDDASDWADITERIKRLESSVAQPPLWEPVALQTNWRVLSNDAANYGLHVAALPGQLILMRGIVERINTAFSFGDATRQLFTIPIGYRPTRTQYLKVWFSDATTSRSIIRLIVATTGLVYVDQTLSDSSAGSVSGAPGGMIGLDGVQFPAF